MRAEDDAPVIGAVLRLQATAGNRAVNRIRAASPERRSTGDVTVQRYRPRGAPAYGEADGWTSFNEEPFRSAAKQPWIKQIQVAFDRVEKDVHKREIPKGQLTATYQANAAALPPIGFEVSGGPPDMITDKGSFTVHRIEGLGYNDPGAAAEKAEKGVKLEGPKRGKHRRYSPIESSGERGLASMDLAVFYHRGEAIHHGVLNEGSHGCVHVDDFSSLAQLNLHSVVGRTRVRVSYTGDAAKTFYPGSASSGTAEPVIDVGRALRLNRVYEKRLAGEGWPGTLKLQTLWWMGFEEMFAKSVAEWQGENMPGEPDGIVGPKTLAALKGS